MKRRAFITLLGGALLTRPLATHAQQPMPVVGLLNGVSNNAYAGRIAAIRQGLGEQGFVEGQNVAIEYRGADGSYDRLPALAADLVRRQVSVIIAIGGTNAPRAAKAATSTIPIVFAVGNDPVESGLVGSFNRPKANVTGVSLSNALLSPKRLELLRELVPGAAVIGFLLNPASPNAATDAKDIPAAAHKLGRELIVLNAGTGEEIEAAFATMAQQGIAALVVENDAFFTARAEQITGLAAHHKMPAIYGAREYIARGGLMSYAPNATAMFRQVGVYTGRILKGEKPGDLPVMQPTKFELIINSKTAKTLGLSIPLTLQVAADEVIE